MPPKGSNDLNALLKAKVVKIRAELDVKGSMPKIKQQVDDISKRLENKPVKLKVVLDTRIAELNKQLKALNSQLQTSKSFKPLKIKVDIDVAGSAKLIKEQLNEVGRAVDDFNKKFGKQINMMAKYSKRAQQEASKATQSAKNQISGNVPNNAGLGSVGMKAYLSQLKEAESEMRRIFGNKGNFSSFEFKDAEGNLRGFIGQLEKASGIVQKVRYDFNKESGKFEIIDQQTITATQKALEKTIGSLKNTRVEIEKLAKSDDKNTLIEGRQEFLKKYKELEKLSKSGDLTQKDVDALNAKIKKEKQLSEVYKFQRKLIDDLAKARRAESRDVQDRDYLKLMAKTKGTNNLEDLKTVRAEYDKLNERTKRYNEQLSQSQKMDIQREKLLGQLKNTLSKATKEVGLASKEEANRTKQMIQSMKSQEAYIKVQQRMAQMNKQVKAQELAEKQRQSLEKLKQSVMQYATATGISLDKANKYFEQLKTRSGNNIGAIERQISRLTNSMTNGKLQRALKQQEQSVVKHLDGMDNRKFKGLVDSRDIEGLKRYVGELNKGSVATMKLVTDSKGMTRIVATMESGGKSARQFSYEIDNVNKKLRQTGQADVFNANRNLGIFEQLRIAMARVPVWMASMTAFYGTIRGVQSMMNEIIQVDTLMTNINRVASDNVNVGAMFEGSVEMSKELGNNLHDILESLGEFARTFGDFNERQLLAITKTATLMSNVSDLSAQEATESLVGTMNAFNISAEKSIRIVDALNEVDNNYAISTKQLAEGLSKTASAGVTFGVGMNQVVGHITAIGSVTMESGKQIGNGLKTIYSRITTLSKSEEVLNGVGVAIRKVGENGEEYVRPVNDILGDLAGKWHELSDSQRQQIAVDVAGRYQLTRFLAMMNNYKTALESTNTAVNSQGSAMRENAKYIKSFESRINQLKNSFTEMSLSIGDAVLSSGMIVVIEGLKDLAEFASLVAKEVGVLPVVFLGLFAVVNKMGVFNKMKNSIMDVVTQVGHFRTSMATATAGGKGKLDSLKAGWNGVAVAEARATAGARAFGISLRGALLSTVIGGAIVFLGFLLEKFINHLADSKQKAEELKKMNESLVSSFRDMGNEAGVNKLVDRYEELSEKAKLTAEETEELNNITTDLANSFPTMVDRIDAQGKAHLKTTSEMREQIQATKDLSKAQAGVETAKFTKNITEQTKEYSKLQKELDKIEKKQERLAKQHGTIEYGTGRDGRGTGRVNNTVKMAENELERILKQAELREAIQNTITTIQTASLAYMEQEGLLGNLGDAQQKVVEQYIALNHETLTSADNSVEAQNELLALGTAVGEVFANAHKEMADAIEGLDLTPAEEMQKLNELEQKFGHIAKAIPEDLFDLDKNGGIDGVIKKLEGVVEATKDIDENSNFDVLHQDLKNAGLGIDEAGQYIANLAVEQENSKLASDAQKKGYEGVAEGVDLMNKEIMEALDLTQELFGYSGAELGALESRFKMMHLLVDIHGEEIKQSERYLALQKEIADALGVSVDKVAEKPQFYEGLVSTMKTIGENLDDYSTSDSWEKWLSNIEGINSKHVDYLLNTEEGREVLGGLISDTGELVEKTEDVAGSQKKVTDSAEETKAKVEELKIKSDEYKNNMNDVTRASYLDTIGSQLADLDGQFTITDDEAGNLKLTMADGSESDYLNGVMGQLSGLDFDLEVTKDKFGNLVLKANDGSGSNVLLNITKDAENTKVNVGEVATELDNVDNKEVKPEIDVDFEHLTGGLGDVVISLDDLQGAFDKLKDNISKITDLETALSGLKGLADNIKDAFASLFSSSKDDLEGLKTKAVNAKDAVNDLKEAINKIKKLASRIDVKGFESIKTACGNAETAIGNLKETMGKISGSADDMASDVSSSTDKVKQAIKKHKDAVSELGDAYSDAKSDVSKAFNSMESSVKSSSNGMISAHNNQKNAVDRLASSARIARTAIANLNSSAQNAMNSLDKYTAKANRARSAGNSVPKAPSSGLFGLFGGAISEGVEGAMSSFGATAGEATGSSGGDGGGTSGTLSQSVYSGTVNTDGNYTFSALAGNSDMPDLFRPNYNERSINIHNGIISQLETKMQRIAQHTLTYRNALKKVIAHQNTVLTLSQKELKTTEKRNSTISSKLKKLGNVSKHTKYQREQYNKLQQEYENNISKIATLKSTVESTINDIKSKSKEIFSNFIDEIVGKYDKAIDKIKKKTDDIDFKLDVLSLTDPENLKSQLGLLAKRSNTQQEERNTLGNKRDSMQSEYDKAVKKYGSASDQAKKVKQELEAVEEAWEDATIAVLRTEKEIKDIRGKVADDSIKMLKDYYKNMKDMSVSAIEAEKKALEEAHKTKMKQYDEQTKAINDVYDAQFKKMDKEKSQAEYQEQLDEKNTNKQELLYKISLLSRDKTLEGRKKLQELKKELTDAEKEISDFMKARQEELLREELEAQKQSQLEAIETKKENEQVSHDDKVAKLDEEKERVSTHYDKIIDDEKLWADKRNEFITGSFTELTSELNTMSQQLTEMNKGNFDNLTDSFKSFSEEVKQQVKELNELSIDNFIFNADGTISAVGQVSGATQSKNVTTGTKVKTPSMTTIPTSTAKPKPAPSKPKPKPAPSPKYHTVKKGDTLWDIAKAIYGNGTDWKKILEANPNLNPNKLQIGKKLLIPFKSGGYTGNDEGVAYLHKKELVLNEKQTEDILDTAKIMNKLQKMIPELKRNNFANTIGEGGVSVTNNYELKFNIGKLNGDKKDADMLVKEVMKGLKKKG